MLHPDIYNDITQTIGNTPLIKLNRVSFGCKANLIAKVESFNPCGSIKDRIALSMIEAAEKGGLITKDTTIIEPTSGNTGIALACVCAAKQYKLILTMPENMSFERIRILKTFGVNVVLTPASEGMLGAINKAFELASIHKDSFIPQQFVNKANPDIHNKTTAREIWNTTKGNIAALVAGVGTGGTITGVGEFLKEKNQNICIVAVEPEDSNVLSGGKPSNHIIQGIGAGFIPDVLDITIIDEIITVSNKNAFNMAQNLARKEGIFCGISSGAATVAAIELAKRDEFENKNIIVILPDTGERYTMMEMS
jgi:cysteine synthase A